MADHIHSLGYLVVSATDPPAWESFGTEVLGMAVAAPPHDGTSSLCLAMDERPYRIQILTGSEDGLLCAGWEVRSPDSLERLRSDLELEGVSVRESTPQERADRGVRELVSFVDPGGATVELFCCPVLTHSPFISPVGVSGFITDPLGLGHIVMFTPSLDQCTELYQRALGFRMSDFMTIGDTRVNFLHCNPRHHSLALVGGERSALAHFMVEARTIDDVGAAFDRFLNHGLRIKQTLGRHSNDHMVSFYAQTPGPFDVEYGFGGRTVDDSTWTPAEITKTSLWGHRRDFKHQRRPES